MAISKERRHELKAQYVDLLNESQAVFLTEYTALDVKTMEDLREKVIQAGGRFHVTKNTLMKIALEETGRPVPEVFFTGQTASGFAMGEVPTLAKAFVDFAKKEESFSLKGAILDQSILSTEDVVALADLPSLDQLRAQIIGLINAPAQNITSAVANSVRQLINVVNAYANKDAEGEAPLEAEAAA